MPKLLILDGNPIVYRAFSAIEQKNSAGVGIGGIGGSLSLLRYLLFTFSPDAVVICWDGPRSQLYRRHLYHGYKSHRDAKAAAHTEEEQAQSAERFRQMQEVKRLFALLPVIQLDHRYMEGDDCAYWLSYNWLPSWRKILVSVDKDWLQMVRNNVRVQITGNKTLYTVGNFRQLNEGLSPRQFVEARILCGDSSDNIPGVYGIGWKTAVKIIKAHGSLQKAKELEKRVADHLPSVCLSELLADLSMFPYPQQLHDSLQRKLAVPVKRDYGAVLDYAVANEMKDMARHWSSFRSVFAKLRGGNEVE